MMTNTQMTSSTTASLEMRWVPTVDERGRTHMESRWIMVDEAHAAPIVQAA